MASDKDRMLSNANYFANIVASAKNACGNAAGALVLPESEIASNWKGDSGDAMVQALSDAHGEINRIYAQLASLESKMRAHTQRIYDNWPKEDLDD